MENSRHRSIFKYHETFGHTFRPNLYVRIHSYEPNNTKDRTSYLITTNSIGGRSQHEPKDGEHRMQEVLFLGCSFTAGDGVSNKHRFTDLLESRLPSLRCHNYALSGTGNDQQYLIHKEIAPRIRPTVLILSPFVGCIGRNVAIGKETFDPFLQRRIFRPKPFFELENGVLKLHNIPVPKVSLHKKEEVLGIEKKVTIRKLSRLFGIAQGLRRRMRQILQPTSDHQQHHVPKDAYAFYDDPQSMGFQLTKAILERTLQESVAYHKILMPLPPHYYFEQDWSPTYLSLYRAVASTTGATLLDVFPTLKAAGKNTIPRLTLSHNHFSELGHAIIADFLASKLGDILAKGKVA